VLPSSRYLNYGDACHPSHACGVPRDPRERWRRLFLTCPASPITLSILTIRAVLVTFTTLSVAVVAAAVTSIAATAATATNTATAPVVYLSTVAARWANTPGRFHSPLPPFSSRDMRFNFSAAAPNLAIDNEKRMGHASSNTMWPLRTKQCPERSACTRKPQRGPVLSKLAQWHMQPSSEDRS